MTPAGGDAGPAADPIGGSGGRSGGGSGFERRGLAQALRCALLAGPALALAPMAAAADFAGYPKVIDGDTVEVQGEVFDLHGIDAPELGQMCAIKGRKYDCGLVARTALLDLTAGATVSCTAIASPSPEAGTDGRPGRCVSGGYDLSEGMAYTGWALADRTISKAYVRYEEGAREAGRGFWRGTFVTPWDWRQGARLPVDNGGP